MNSNTAMPDADVYMTETKLCSEDQQYIAELRKFFEMAVRDMFLLIGQYAEDILDKDYIRRVIATTKRDEPFLLAMIRDAIKEVIKRDFADAAIPVTIYRDDEVVALIRNEASLLMSVYRKIKSIESERRYLEGRE